MSYLDRYSAERVKPRPRNGGDSPQRLLGVISDRGGRRLIERILSRTGQGQEAVSEEASLARYQEQYDRIPGYARSRCPWKTVVRKLRADHGEKLRKAEAMQGGGELFGVDKQGRALFKDKSTEPVMFGFDEEHRLTLIYDHDRKLMDQVKYWANGNEIEARVTADGYELFADNGRERLGDEMRQSQAYTGEPFVQGAEGSTPFRKSLLKNGRWASFAQGSVHIMTDHDNDTGCINCGAIRLLRV